MRLELRVILLVHALDSQPCLGPGKDGLFELIMDGSREQNRTEIKCQHGKAARIAEATIVIDRP